MEPEYWQTVLVDLNEIKYKMVEEGIDGADYIQQAMAMIKSNPTV